MFIGDMSTRELFDLNTAQLKGGSSTEATGRELMSRTDFSQSARNRSNAECNRRRENANKAAAQA